MGMKLPLPQRTAPTDGIRHAVDDLEECGADVAGWLLVTVASNGAMNVMSSLPKRDDVLTVIGSAARKLREAGGAPGATQ